MYQKTPNRRHNKPSSFLFSPVAHSCFQIVTAQSMTNACFSSGIHATHSCAKKCRFVCILPSQLCTRQKRFGATLCAAIQSLGRLPLLPPQTLFSIDETLPTHEAFIQGYMMCAYIVLVIMWGCSWLKFPVPVSEVGCSIGSQRYQQRPIANNQPLPDQKETKKEQITHSLVGSFSSPRNCVYIHFTLQVIRQQSCYIPMRTVPMQQGRLYP